VFSSIAKRFLSRRVEKEQAKTISPCVLVFPLLFSLLLFFVAVVVVVVFLCFCLGFNSQSIKS
jgi:hypothetical protein